MTFFRTWLFGIVAASMALSILYALLPKGAILTAAKCAGSLILILVMLRPLVTLRVEDLAVPYDVWEERTAEQTEQLTQDNLSSMEALIEEECSAYISEKAAQLGVTVKAEVLCEVRDGVPFPAEVTLDIPYNEMLSDTIAADLDIPYERQHWQEN
ncbi:MAG: hypothetical protein IJE94_04305 [Oscillospiraceae bacterium]|nr:hypothetical protein [Oscillospiraceae bacterium]